MNLETFYRQCDQLASHIETRQKKIHDILSSYQTYEVIEHEIHSSIEALKNVRAEYDDFEHPNFKVTASTYLPVNMPLYSLILYAVLPSYYFSTVYVRPGVSLSSYIPRLIEVLSLQEVGFHHIQVKDLPAKLFTELFAKDSEIVLFTGKYENALMLERECPDSMLIFEGTGPCPFFAFEDSDVELVAQKAVEMRCFNSGQDCVAPDVIFVHKSKLNALVENLKSRLRQVQTGSTNDPAVRVGHAIKEKYLLSIESWLDKNHNAIQFGGEIDTKNLIVHPTILTKNVLDHKGKFTELFAPIFYILSYDDHEPLLKILNSPSFRERSMYASVFGNDEVIVNNLQLCTVLEDMHVNDQENGNKPYGGYGPIANFVSYRGERLAQPLLISRDVRDWMLLKQGSNLAKQSLQVA